MIHGICCLGKRCEGPTALVRLTVGGGQGEQLVPVCRSHRSMLKSGVKGVVKRYNAGLRRHVPVAGSIPVES